MFTRTLGVSQGSGIQRENAHFGSMPDHVRDNLPPDYAEVFVVNNSKLARSTVGINGTVKEVLMDANGIPSAVHITELNARATDAICVTVNDRIAYANRPTLSLFGMQRPEECLGRSFLELFDPDIQPILKAGIRRLLEKKSESLLVDESKIIRSDHIVVDVVLRVVRLDWDGEPAIQVTFG
jgi:PAS domain S-box-containing protein